MWPGSNSGGAPTRRARAGPDAWLPGPIRNLDPWASAVLVVSPYVVAELDYLVASRLGVSAELAVLRELAGGATRQCTSDRPARRVYAVGRAREESPRSPQNRPMGTDPRGTRSAEMQLGAPLQASSASRIASISSCPRLLDFATEGHEASAPRTSSTITSAETGDSR
jgi:hypothetical protein